MKKLVLTAIVLVTGFIGFAQDNAAATTKSDVIRITEDMSNDDIGLEFINNYYKIELSEVTSTKKEYKSINKNKQHTANANKNVLDESNTHIILDLAVRTTDYMRPSLNSVEEITV